jgi:hypothetical protein
VALADDPLHFVSTYRPIAGDAEKVVGHAGSPSTRVTWRGKCPPISSNIFDEAHTVALAWLLVLHPLGHMHENVAVVVGG